MSQVFKGHIYNKISRTIDLRVTFITFTTTIYANLCVCLSHVTKFDVDLHVQSRVYQRIKIVIAQFRYIKIQPKTIDLSTRLVGITTEFVGFIPTSLVLRSIVLG